MHLLSGDGVFPLPAHSSLGPKAKFMDKNRQNRHIRDGMRSLCCNHRQIDETILASDFIIYGAISFKVGRFFHTESERKFHQFRVSSLDWSASCMKQCHSSGYEGSCVRVWRIGTTIAVWIDTLTCTILFPIIFQSL